MRDALAASARMAQLVVQRRQFARVRRDFSGGWRHDYRAGTLVTATLRSPTWQHCERATDQFCARYRPRAGDTVVELGAGTGTETVQLARAVGPGGRVIACEAHPDTARLLRRTVECNELANVVVVEAAVTGRNGAVTISDLPSAAGVANALDPAGGVTVIGRTFDDLVDELGLARIDFLKVNIEGAERSLVAPLSSAWQIVGNAVVSCHDFRAEAGDGEGFRTRDLVRHALESAGFDVSDRPESPLPWVRDYLYATRPNARP